MDLVEALDSLMNCWCERAALRPIQLLLRAYPGPLWHRYHKMELLEILQVLDEQCGDELRANERRILTEAMQLLEAALPAEGADPNSRAGESPQYLYERSSPPSQH